eukprot:3169288-Heterocapsa_arctica.AAC.2
MVAKWDIGEAESSAPTGEPGGHLRVTGVGNMVMTLAWKLLQILLGKSQHTRIRKHNALGGSGLRTS